MIDYAAFAQAARNLDAIAEERGVDAALEHASLDPKAAKQIADQRAVRMALLATGDGEKLADLVRRNAVSTVELTDAQKKLVPLLGSVYLDAMATTHLAGTEAHQW
jgi:hypothetical protein